MAINALIDAEANIPNNLSKEELAKRREEWLKNISNEELTGEIEEYLPSWWAAAKNFSYTAEEEVDQFSNLLNNGTKGWVVGGQAEWFPKPEPYFGWAGNILGWTNVYKETGTIQGDELTAVVDGAQASQLWLGERTFSNNRGRPGVKFEKAPRKYLGDRVFFRI